MKTPLAELQIGKKGITENFLETLKTYFKNHQNVKISVLKSARPEGNKGREIVLNYKNKIINSLGPRYSARIIGFTIAVKKGKLPKDKNN